MTEDQMNISPFPYPLSGQLFLIGFVLESFRVIFMTPVTLLPASVYLKLVIMVFIFFANLLTEYFPFL